MQRFGGHRLYWSALCFTLACAAVFTPARAQDVATEPPGTPAETSPAPLTPSPSLERPPEPPPIDPTATPAPAVPPPTHATPAAIPPSPPPAATTASSEADADPCEACAHRRRSADYLLGVFIGAGFFDLSDLNDRLAANGYERLDDPMLVIGGEARGISPMGFVYGVHGAGIVGSTGEGPGALETNWSGGYAMADFGYAPIRLRAFLLAITAGVGGYGVTFQIADNREVDFDEVLDSPRRHSELTRGGLAFGLTLRIDARIPMGPVRYQHQSYLALGIRLSGLFGPAISDWSLPDDDDADGGPSSGLTGAYAAFVLGWGGQSTEAAR